MASISENSWHQVVTQWNSLSEKNGFYNKYEPKIIFIKIIMADFNIHYTLRFYGMFKIEFWKIPSIYKLTTVNIIYGLLKLLMRSKSIVFRQLNHHF